MSKAGLKREMTEHSFSRFHISSPPLGSSPDAFIQIFSSILRVRIVVQNGGSGPMDQPIWQLLLKSPAHCVAMYIVFVATVVPAMQ